MHRNCFGTSTIEVFVDYSSLLIFWSVICVHEDFVNTHKILKAPTLIKIKKCVKSSVYYFLSPASLDMLTRMGQLKVCTCSNIPQSYFALFSLFVCHRSLII